LTQLTTNDLSAVRPFRTAKNKNPWDLIGSTLVLYYKCQHLSLFSDIYIYQIPTISNTIYL